MGDQESKEFHLRDILSVIYDRLLSPSMNNVHEIKDFITGNDPKLTRECKDYLSEQFPQLASPEMDFAVARLAEMLKSPVVGNNSDMLIVGWLAEQTAKYGEMFSIQPIPQTN